MRRIRRRKSWRREFIGGLLFHSFLPASIVISSTPTKSSTVLSWFFLGMVGVCLLATHLIELSLRKNGLRPWPTRQSSWHSFAKLIAAGVAISILFGISAGFAYPAFQGKGEFDAKKAIEKGLFVITVAFYQLLCFAANYRYFRAKLIDKGYLPARSESVNPKL